MNDQGHPTQHPAKSEAKVQSLPHSDPRPHIKKRVLLEQDKMSQLLWEVASSPCELTQALGLYSIHPKPSFAANFTSKGKKKEEEKQNKPSWLYRQR